MIRPPQSPVASGAQRLQKLMQLANERIRQGFAPPREIYSIQYRDRIDWSQFPGWARPLDPEVFEESCHEG